MSVIHNHHGQTRPDGKMGRQRTVTFPGPGKGTRTAPSSIQRQVEQRRAARKRRQRDRTEARDGID